MQYLSTSMPAFPSATAMYKALAKKAAEDARQQAELEASAEMAEEQERLERLMKMKSASMSNIGRVLDEDKDAYETMRWGRLFNEQDLIDSQVERELAIVTIHTSKS